MKNNTERDAIIFSLWQKGCTYKEIENMKFQSSLSLRRIRNIIYGGLGKLKSPREQEIYKMFRTKFLELQNVYGSIVYVYMHQPQHSLRQRQIRNIVNQQLKKQRETSNKK